MQACMEANNKRFDDFVRVRICDISELKASLQFTQKELQEVKHSVNVNNDGNIAADKLLAKLTDDIKRVDDAADYMENQSRRNNLRVDGGKEKPGGDVAGGRDSASAGRPARAEAASRPGRRSPD